MNKDGKSYSLGYIIGYVLGKVIKPVYELLRRK
nr:MAG TPA: 1,3-beta-glucan synthase component [Caudoviricetes sp.]